MFIYLVIDEEPRSRTEKSIAKTAFKSIEEKINPKLLISLHGHLQTGREDRRS